MVWQRTSIADALENRPGLVRVALFILVLGGFVLRLYRLGYQSLWYDETVSLLLAKKDLAALIAHTAGDIHPPLYYSLLHFWLLLAGDSEFSAAFFSLFFGVFLIALVYRLARELLGPTVGLIAAFLVTTSPYNLWYSQEVRMYTLGASLGILSVYFLVKFQRYLKFDVWYLVIYTLVTALGLYTLYYFAFLIVFENLFVLGVWLWQRGWRGRWGELARWVAAQLAVVVLYAPWIPVAFRQATNPPVPPWRSFIGLDRMLIDSWSALSFGQSVEPSTVWPLLVIVLVVYGIGLVASAQRPATSILLLGYTWVPVLIISLVSLVVPLYHVRYVFTYSPAFYIVAAAGLAWLLRRWPAIFAMAVALLIGTSAYSVYNFHFDSRYAKDDQRAAVTYIAQHWRSGDAVLINAGYVYAAFDYYFRAPVAWQGRLANYPPSGIIADRGPVVVESGTIGGSPNLGWSSPTSDFYATTESQTAESLAAVFAHHPRVWVLRCYDTVTDPTGFIRVWLDDHGRQFDEITVTGESNIRVQGYFTSPQPVTAEPTLAHRLNASLGGQVTLLGFDSDITTIAAGQPIDVVLWWRVQSKLGVNLRRYAALFDANGRRWAEIDEEPVGPLYRATQWIAGELLRDPVRLVVTVGMPPSTYSLEVGLHDPNTGRFLEVNDQQHGMQGVRVRLGTVVVIKPVGAVIPPTMPNLSNADFGGELRLLGYAVGPGEVKPGDTIHVDLLWQVESRRADDRRVVLRLEDSKGQAMVQQEGAPFTRWDAGEMVRGQHDLLIPADVADGMYRLMLRVPPLTVRWWIVPIGDSVELSTIRVASRLHSFVAPQGISHPMAAQLGSLAKLIGYNLSSDSVAPSETLRLTLYWQAVSKTSTSLKVFTHLVDEGGRIVGQHDAVPCGGGCPTTGWVPGEYLVDEYEIAVKPDTPPGEYVLEVGLYDEATGVRLQAFDAQGKPLDDKVVLGKVKVR
jgi:4-amino-4-deoxy-L-arabinose transferase-like glycosyltransferase